MKTILLALPLWSALAFGQSLAEHTAAAAGGAGAGMAGKQISDGIDKVFGRLQVQAEQLNRAMPAKPKPRREAKPAEAAPVTFQQPLSKAPVARRPRKPAARPAPAEPEAAPDPAPAAQPAPAAPPPPPPPPAPSASDFARLSPGQPREQLASLGTPAARISMPDADGLLEIYRYRMRDGGAASVRISNGRVSEVTVSGQAPQK